MIRPRLLPLFLTYLIGNAFVMAIAYWWLGTNESDAAHLILSAVSALFILAAAAWLQGLALACFCGFTYSESLKRATRHLPSLILLVVLALALYGFLSWIDGRFGHFWYVIASFITMTIRRPVAPHTIASIFHAAVTLARWVILPVVLFPLAASVTVRGWSGWHLSFLRRRRAWLYWLEVALLLLVAVWIPWHLFYWIPPVENFWGQMASFVSRAAAGYLLFVIGILAVEFFTSTGSPRETQPNTVAVP